MDMGNLYMKKICVSSKYRFLLKDLMGNNLLFNILKDEIIQIN